MIVLPTTLLLLIGAVLNFVNGASVTPQSRIVSDENAAAGEFPWQVSLRKSIGQHFCGGTLISSTKVLTAAYCVESSSPENIHVVTGSTSLINGGEYHDVSHIVYHENYTDSAEYSWRYDIAIVTLATAAQNSQLQSPIVFATTQTSENTEAITSGWGSTIYPGVVLPTDLHKFNLTIISNEECQTYHTLTIYDDQICALSEYGQGVCRGDSGGGLVIDGTTIVGITSWVRPCGLGYPDVYVRVSSFANWILEHISDA